MIGKIIYYQLSNDANVASIVGNRIYMDMPPQDVAFPFIVYSINGTAPTNTKDYNTKSVLDSLTIQIDMYTRKVTDSANLSNYVRNRLDGYQGEFLGMTIKQTRFLDEVSGDRDMEMGVYYRSQDYEFHLHKSN